VSSAKKYGQEMAGTSEKRGMLIFLSLAIFIYTQLLTLLKKANLTKKEKKTKVGLVITLKRPK
jgi:hypothetical protein